MSAQEREALVRELVTLFGPGTFGSTGPELYEFEAERIADAIIAAGWSRPVPATGEAATEGVVERAAKAITEAHSTVKAAGAPADSSNWLGEHAALWLARQGLLAGGVPGRSEAEPGMLRIEDHWLVRDVDHCTCSPHYGAHERHCGSETEVDLSILPGWRSEAEIKAEALREAADAWRGGPTGAAPIPRWWLDDRAARVAGTTEAGDES